MELRSTSAHFPPVVFIGQSARPCFFLTHPHENLPTSVTTISTKCIFYKRIIFQTVWDSVLGFSSAEILASEMRKQVVHTNNK